MTTAVDPKNMPFEEDFKDVLQELRTSLTELMTAVGADPTRPQDAARLLGVNKNLTWKVSKIIRELDPGAVVPQIPGKGGFRILFRATRKCGAPLELIELVEQALARFDELVDTHSGDRDTLELMAGHLSREIDPARAEIRTKTGFPREQRHLGRAGTYSIVREFCLSQRRPRLGQPGLDQWTGRFSSTARRCQLDDCLGAKSGRRGNRVTVGGNRIAGREFFWGRYGTLAG